MRSAAIPRIWIPLGIACAALGALLMLMPFGVLPAPKRVLAPDWVVFCAGLIFAVCGGAVAVGAARGASPEAALDPGRARRPLLGLLVFAAFAAILNWIAFGPGPRNFVGAAPFFDRGPVDETLGRIAFGIPAVLLTVLWLLAVSARLRRLFGRAGDHG